MMWIFQVERSEDLRKIKFPACACFREPLKVAVFFGDRTTAAIAQSGEVIGGGAIGFIDRSAPDGLNVAKLSWLTRCLRRQEKILGKVHSILPHQLFKVAHVDVIDSVFLPVLQSSI
jgi:hypothetical protein